MKVKHNDKAPSFVKLPPPFHFQLVNYIFREVPLDSEVLSSEVVLLNTLGYFIFPSLRLKSYIQMYFIHTHKHTTV